MSVVGMSDDLSCGVVLEFVFGANESVLQSLLLGFAVFAICRIWPDASSAVVVKV